jgi:hypothetical protein
MKGTDKLRVLLPHWIEHNGEHAAEFRQWAEEAATARSALLDAARLLEAANARLQEGLAELGGPLEHT